MTDRIDEDLKRGLDRIARGDYTPGEKEALSGFAEDEHAREDPEARKYSDVLNAMHEDFVKLDDGLEDLRVRTDAVEADMSDEDIADPTLTDEENAATGPIVSFDLGAFREEAGAESFNSFTRGGLRHFVESFVISDRSFREVGEWSEWEDSGCGKQTRSREVLLKNGAKTFRGQVRDKPPKVYSDRFGDEPQSLPEEIALDKAKVNAFVRVTGKREEKIEALFKRAHDARTALRSIQRIAEDLDLRRDSLRSVERIHHIVNDGIAKSDPS